MTWGSLPDAKEIKEYFEKKPFPKDALYSKRMFWEDYENKYGYISLVVEKRETAQFICDLCAALIMRHNKFKEGVKYANRRF